MPFREVKRLQWPTVFRPPVWAERVAGYWALVGVCSRHPTVIDEVGVCNQQRTELRKG